MTYGIKPKYMYFETNRRESRSCIVDLELDVLPLRHRSYKTKDAIISTLGRSIMCTKIEVHTNNPKSIMNVTIFMLQPTLFENSHVDKSLGFEHSHVYVF